MGDCQNEDLRVGFDSRLKLKFYGSQVTTDAGLLAYRKLDEALGLTEMGEHVLTDSRQGRNKQHQLVPLLRQSIYSRLAGYEDVNAPSGCVWPRRYATWSVVVRHYRRSKRLRAARWAASRRRRSARSAISRR